MALDDQQWGRILALAWLDDEFRKKFEMNPLTAFAYLKEHEDTFKQDYGDYFLEELGLKGNDVILTNFQVMAWDGVNFAEMSGDRLDECIQGTNIENLGPDQSIWFWNMLLGDALVEASATNGEPRTLTPTEWVRIYARLWMDLRFDELTMPNQIRAKYERPIKGQFVEEFDKNPTDVIGKIAKEFSDKVDAGELGWKKLDYVLNRIRLYSVIGKPQDWTPQELAGCVRTGNLRTFPLTWVLKKC